MKDQQPVVFRLRLIPWPDSTFSLLPAPQMEVAALPGFVVGQARRGGRCYGNDALVRQGPGGSQTSPDCRPSSAERPAFLCAKPTAGRRSTL